MYFSDTNTTQLICGNFVPAVCSSIRIGRTFYCWLDHKCYFGHAYWCEVTTQKALGQLNFLLVSFLVSCEISNVCYFPL